MPRRITRNTGITELQKEMLLTGGGWLAIADTWPEDERRNAWAQCGDELMEEYLADPANRFTRPAAWWDFSAPEPRCTEDAGYETQASYLARHPELLTPAEVAYLRDHGLTRWQTMPCSEMADLEYLRSHPQLLKEDERAAMYEHIKSTTPELSGSIQ